MKQKKGNETWFRLRNWTHGQPPAERLGAHVLRVEDFLAVDPIHPLGGPDGLKDVVCCKENKKYIAAVYFPNGQQTVTNIKGKFHHDMGGIDSNNADGIVFITNQEITLGEREKLKAISTDHSIELYHLERLASILDSPPCYGLRLEFLDIEMSKEEQISFIDSRDKMIEKHKSDLETIISYLKRTDLLDKIAATKLDGIPLTELQQFQEILNSIAGQKQPWLEINSALIGLRLRSGHISDLNVPLVELKEFAVILDHILGNNMFSAISPSGHLSLNPKTIDSLHVPLGEIKEFENTLDRIIRKLQIKRQLENG